VREQLAEHLLGTLDEVADADVRRHLRVCGSCRADLAALSEGIDTLARAAHDVEPPEDLRDSVIAALQAEWTDVVVLPTRRPRRIWVARGAVALTVAASLVWGAVATVHAVRSDEAAERYEAFLGVLGGEDVRVGELRAAGSQELQGSVVIYDSKVGQSWVLVLCRAPGWAGTANVTMIARGGERTIELRPMEFGPGGEGSTWLVTATDLTEYDRVTVWSASGVMASAHVEHA
jgi:hypothetical protein